MKKKKNSSQWELLQLSQVSTVKRLGNWLTARKSHAIKHLPDNVALIERVFKKCVVLIFLLKKSVKARNKIFSILEFPVKNKWTIFLDKLTTSSDQSMLSIYLFKTLVQELISSDKACKPFWTPAYKELSEKLLSPIETDLVGSDSISLKLLLKNRAAKLPFLITRNKKVQNRSLQMTSYQLSTSSVAGKWEKEVIKKKKLAKLKTVKIKLFPKKQQRKNIKEIIDVSRFVYNRTIEYIEQKGYSIDFETLRDELVTCETKKNSVIYKYMSSVISKLYKLKYRMKEEFDKSISMVKEHLKGQDKNLIKEYENTLKQSYLEEDTKVDDLIELRKKDMKEMLQDVETTENPLIHWFEKDIHKDIRAGAIRAVCANYKSAFENLKAGNIKSFSMSFKKKSDPKQQVELDKKLVSICDGKLTIYKGKWKQDSVFKMSSKNTKKYKNLIINHNVDITFSKGNYYLCIPVDITPEKDKQCINYIGIDPGVRTFATCHGNQGITEYNHNQGFLDKLNNKISFLKGLKRTRKKQISKIEKKKIDMINSLHWEVINDLTRNNDVIFFGDIKSHNIVKNGKNKTLNTNFNDLKFYMFKTRLLYKCFAKGKKVFFVNEAYTTQGCSRCGTLNQIGDNKVYTCSSCSLVCDRDINSAKNICMKGINSL